MNAKKSYTATPQAPIGSGFGAKTTAREVLKGLDLGGKTAIVTGGYSGVGLETTRALAEAGATVIVPARTPEKARQALTGISRVEMEALDLADPASIDAFAARFLDSGRSLDFLINNAGIMVTSLRRDKRGYEIQFATSHLGHFQLTARLWPALVKANGARVISLSSIGAQVGGMDFDDPNFERREYERYAAYGQSKTATSLFAVALDRRGYSYGVRAFAVHPGAVMTDLVRDMSEEEVQASSEQYEFKTSEQGAATSVWCAVSPQLADMGGVYCEDVDISGIIAEGSPFGPGVLPRTIDPEFADRLWKLSEEMTGVTFDI